MPRKRRVKRNIPIFRVWVMCINLEKQTQEERPFDFRGKVGKKGETLRKLRRLHETEFLKLVAVTRIEKILIPCVMTEDFFWENSVHNPVEKPPIPVKRKE